MNSGQHYLISADGSYRWDLTVTPIQVDQAVSQALTTDAKLNSKSLIQLDPLTGGEFGKASLLVGNNQASWCVEVSKLHLRTPYRLVDGIHIPNFGSGEDPVLDLVWLPPMAVRFVVDLVWDSGLKLRLRQQWLFALDSQLHTYRLPLPNTYGDCHLCHGMDDYAYPTQAEAVLTACGQLQKSLWNADLSPDLALSQRMFRWKPTEQGFDQLPPALSDGQNWTDLCVKVGVSHLAEVL